MRPGADELMAGRKEVIARLRSLEPHFSEIGYGFGRDGHPTVEGNGDSRREGLLTRAEIENAVAFLQTYLDICPDDITVAHSNLRLCGNETCEECYRREKSRARHYLFGEDEIGAQQRWSGFVCLVKVGELFDFCATGDPAKKVHQLSRSYSEPVELIHALPSNHQMLSKLWWLRAVVDYKTPKSRFFQITPRVVELFKSQQEHCIASEDDHSRIMGAVEEALHVPANLPRLLKLAYGVSRFHDEAIGEALRQGKPLP